MCQIDLGIGAHIVANVIWMFLMIKNVYDLANQDQLLKRLVEDIKQWYRQNAAASKYDGKLNLDRIRIKGGRPKMKIKAAACRHLSRFALALAQTHADPEDVCEMRAVGIITLLVEVYELVREGDMFLSDTVKTRIATIGIQLGSLYEAAAKHARDNRQKLWKLMPKLHLFQHLCAHQTTFGNPRFWWTYADEDLVRHMQASVHPSTLSSSVLFKWLHLYYELDLQ